MAVDVNTVKHIAYLARLKVPEDELQTVADELEGVCQWAEHLKEVNTDNVEPLTSVLDIDTPLIYREDVVSDGNIRDNLMSQAKEEHEGYYVVPQVVE